MASLQEKIAGLFPAATFEEVDGTLTVSIADEQWHDLARTLKKDPEISMDYLVTIIGMDWVTSLGCVYYFMSTKFDTQIAVKVATTDRTNPMLHSVADLWAVGTLYEREVYDFFGIIFINNPDMRRLFLSIDWKGYPLRKDYDDSPELNPVSTDNERISDTSDRWVEKDGAVVKETYNIFNPEDFVINIGPQHPQLTACFVSALLSKVKKSRKSMSTWAISTAVSKNSAKPRCTPRPFTISTVSTTSRA